MSDKRTSREWTSDKREILRKLAVRTVVTGRTPREDFRFYMDHGWPARHYLSLCVGRNWITPEEELRLRNMVGLRGALKVAFSDEG